MRVLAVIVFVVTAGHVLLPLLFLPLGLFSFGHHRRRETNGREQVTP